jgi:hypothetical protein
MNVLGPFAARTKESARVATGKLASTGPPGIGREVVRRAGAQIPFSGLVGGEAGAARSQEGT